jgi:hypothetical protein
MNRRLFTSADVTPTEALLRKQLGSANKYYLAITGKAGAYRKQWHFSRGNGWILKFDDMQKALFYLIAFDEGIEISLTVRENERTDFLRNIELEQLHPQLELGTKYAEGYALRFGIENATDCKSVMLFLDELMKVRPYKGNLGKVSKESKWARNAKIGHGLVMTAKGANSK